jgi:hypothetical protein
LWAFATFFLFGDLGKWADDYGFGMRNPADGTYQQLTPSSPRFVRPLSRKLVALHTLLWFHDGWKHALSAMSHGLTALLLWCVLRALRCRNGIATAFALLFLVYPAPYEVVFWVSALGYSLASSLFLVLSLLVLHLAARAKLSVFWLVVLAVLAFALVCLNEQPASGMVALPLLYLYGASPKLPRVRRFLGACGVLAVCGCAVLLYLALYLHTTNPMERGTPGTLTTLPEVPVKAAQLAGEIHHALLLPGFRRGALHQGLAEISARPVRTILWTSLLAGVGAWWMVLRGGLRLGSSVVPPPEDRRIDVTPRGSSLVCSLAFGTTLFFAAWIPIFVVHDQGVVSRLTYFPTIGLVVVGASLVDVLATRAERRHAWGRTLRLASIGLLVASLTVGAISMVGVQGLFHRRKELDAYQAAQLRELVPTPDDSSIFVPLRLTRSTTHTGRAAFDDVLPGPFEYAWVATHFVRWTYRRADLFAAWQSTIQPSNVRGVDEQGMYFFRLTYLYPQAVPYRALDGDLHLLPWNLVVPFVTDPDGHVRLVTELVVRNRDGSEQRFAPPQTLRASADRHLAAYSLTIELAPPA